MNRLFTRAGQAFVLTGLTAALGIPTPALGLKMVAGGPGGEGRKVPVHVKAERMDVDHASNQIRFSGNVVTARGSMVIRSDVLDVFTTGSGGGADEIRKIKARGNVQFENEGRRATGDEATYLAKERIVVLTGKARAWDDENVVTGHEMTLYQDEDRSVVVGGADRRVEVTLNSGFEGQEGFKRRGKSEAGSDQEKVSPVHVTADRMESDHRRKTVFFEGKVITWRVDFRMTSDELEVFNSNKDSRRVSKIVARGNVRINRGGKVATGDKAVYYEHDRKFLLTGNAKAWESQNVVSGNRMEIYLDEDKSVVLGDGKEQVEVTIYPRETPTSKQPLLPPDLTVGGSRAASQQ